MGERWVWRAMGGALGGSEGLIWSRAEGRTERGCVPRRRHHPQQRVDIRRSRFLQTLTPPVTLLRLIPLARDTVALRFAGGALGEGNSGRMPLPLFTF